MTIGAPECCEFLWDVSGTQRRAPMQHDAGDHLDCRSCVCGAAFRGSRRCRVGDPRGCGFIRPAAYGIPTSGGDLYGTNSPFGLNGGFYYARADVKF